MGFILFYYCSYYSFAIGARVYYFTLEIRTDMNARFWLIGAVHVDWKDLWLWNFFLISQVSEQKGLQTLILISYVSEEAEPDFEVLFCNKSGINVVRCLPWKFGSNGEPHESRFQCILLNIIWSFLEEVIPALPKGAVLPCKGVVLFPCMGECFVGS